MIARAGEGELLGNRFVIAHIEMRGKFLQLPNQLIEKQKVI